MLLVYNRRAASGCFPSSHRPFYRLCQLQSVGQPEPQAVIALRDDLVHELAGQLPLEGIQELRTGRQGLYTLLGPPDCLILLGLQEPFLFQFYGTELFRQLVPAGDKNIRINKPLLLELGQQSILTGDIRDFLVELHNVQAPEQLALSSRLKVCKHLAKNGQTLVAELVV